MKKTLPLATWNVRTLLDLKDAKRQQRQTALIAPELDSCPPRNSFCNATRNINNNIFFWLEKEPATRREVGVVFAIASKGAATRPKDSYE